MKLLLPRAVLAFGLMLLAAVLAFAGKPRVKIADAGPKVNLETLVPEEFGEWRIDTSVVPVLPSPESQAVLNKIYNQTLSRTYVNPKGERVMLSIAYGGDQSDTMQVHKPEGLLSAQGFSILKNVKTYLATQFGQLPVKHLLAVQGARHEPITYWITVGDQVARTGLEHKLAQVKYGLSGKVPDGMLVRVSTIDRDETRAYRTQEEFLQSMLHSMSAADRVRLAGRFGA